MAANKGVAIVGGGIGGLTAALALVRHGIAVDVYEQAPELKELGAGVQISSNGTRVLYALGLGEAIEKVGVVVAGKEIRLWSTGQTWKLFDLGAISVERYGFPYMMFHRGDLHAALLNAILRERPMQSISTGNAPASRRTPMASPSSSKTAKRRARPSRSAPTAYSRACGLPCSAPIAGVHRHRRLARAHSEGTGAGRHQA